MVFSKNNDKFPSAECTVFNFQNNEGLYKTTCHIYLVRCFFYEVISVFKIFSITMFNKEK